MWLMLAIVCLYCLQPALYACLFLPSWMTFTSLETMMEKNYIPPDTVYFTINMVSNQLCRNVTHTSDMTTIHYSHVIVW